MSDTVCCPKCRTLVRDDRTECELCGGELVREFTAAMEAAFVVAPDQPAAVPIGPDGRCLCSCMATCPLGKTGLAYRCSEQELWDSGIEAKRVVVCATCRVRPAANGSLCEVCLGRKDNQPDLIAHPPHYTAGKIECIDAIESALTPEEFRGYLKGNVLAYCWRERHKGGQLDVEKALWYLRRLAGAPFHV